MTKAQKAWEPIQSDINREAAKGRQPKTFAAAWDDDKQEWVIKKSGYHDPEDLRKVRQVGNDIGHIFKPAGAMDRIDGEIKSGTFFTSHAEEKVMVNTPDAPIAEGPKEMCDNCVEFPSTSLHRIAKEYWSSLDLKSLASSISDGKIGVVNSGEVHIFDNAKDVYSDIIRPRK